ncbi:enoyl-CoA hydratase-related protein [Caldiplasma sukawensis]
MAKVKMENRKEISIITIERSEKKNAIDAETARELGELFTDFEFSDSKVAIITGAGDSFCSGADLGDAEALSRRVMDGNGPLGVTRRFITKPVIAAISGYCVAGGLELALWADIRVCDSTSKFGFLERRYGVPLIDGGTMRLPWIVGLGRALDLIMTGKLIDAKEAMNIGLVNYVYEKDDLIDKTIELAEKISSFPWNTVIRDREALYLGLGGSSFYSYAAEAILGRQTINEGIVKEGSKKFLKGER